VIQTDLWIPVVAWKERSARGEGDGFCRKAAQVSPPYPYPCERRTLKPTAQSFPTRALDHASSRFDPPIDPRPSSCSLTLDALPTLRTEDKKHEKEAIARAAAIAKEEARMAEVRPILSKKIPRTPAL